MFLRLSSFQLSGIIILVFSKQKGLTLVFRNDPVDSVKVSSTFDSIPAIQRFLQAEIERLLRDLMREEVPAIIHKLSLEWAMRNQADECLTPASLTNTQPENPISVQSYPYALEADANDPLRPIFSDANLHRLSELTLAQHTLSPFTASIPQSVFRSSTSLIASLRQRTMRPHELYTARNAESEIPYYRTSDTSPPESVLSVQSTDLSLRPSLYSRRQRSSYLRRSHPPKRKIVRLHPSRSGGTSDTASISYSDSSERGDYFSEPGGYRSSFQPEPPATWNEKDSISRDKAWESEAFSKGWNNNTNEIGKYGANSWIANQRYNHPPSKEATASNGKC
jgi:mitochondrial distribution and morphology protein 34